MKEGFSKATGHNIERRYSDHDKRISNLDWDFANKKWITGRNKYFYCIDCEQFMWGQQPMCPKNTEVKYEPVLVVRGRK